MDFKQKRHLRAWLLHNAPLRPDEASSRELRHWLLSTLGKDKFLSHPLSEEIIAAFIRFHVLNLSLKQSSLKPGAYLSLARDPDIGGALREEGWQPDDVLRPHRLSSAAQYLLNPSIDALDQETITKISTRDTGA